MADPTKSKILSVTFSGGYANMPVKIYNETNSEFYPGTIKMDSNGKVLIDCNNFSTAVGSADIISFSCTGSAAGTVKITLSGDKSQSTTKTLTAVSTTLPRGGF